MSGGSTECQTNVIERDMRAGISCNERAVDRLKEPIVTEACSDPVPVQVFFGG